MTLHLCAHHAKTLPNSFYDDTASILILFSDLFHSILGIRQIVFTYIFVSNWNDILKKTEYKDTSIYMHMRGQTISSSSTQTAGILPFHWFFLTWHYFLPASISRRLIPSLYAPYCPVWSLCSSCWYTVSASITCALSGFTVFVGCALPFISSNIRKYSWGPHPTDDQNH